MKRSEIIVGEEYAYATSKYHSPTRVRVLALDVPYTARSRSWGTSTYTHPKGGVKVMKLDADTGADREEAAAFELNGRHFTKWSDHMAAERAKREMFRQRERAEKLAEARVRTLRIALRKCGITAPIHGRYGSISIPEEALDELLGVTLPTEAK